jgi:hypothetical protein
MMSDLTTELRQQAEADIAAAREAALRARTSHGRAELMRHMMMAAAKVPDRSREEAVDFVMVEWLTAWGLDRATCPQSPQMEALAGACHDALRAPGPESDAALRTAFAALERAYAVAGTSVADEMAWRSGCSHVWWADIRPAPAGAGYSKLAARTETLWERGCAPHCL